MSEHFGSISNKLDKILDEISKIKVIQERHDVNLEQHMKRSDHLEALYEYLMEEKIEPIEANLNQIKGIYKFIGLLGIIAGIVGIFVKFH